MHAGMGCAFIEHWLRACVSLACECEWRDNCTTRCVRSVSFNLRAGWRRWRCCCRWFCCRITDKWEVVCCAVDVLIHSGLQCSSSFLGLSLAFSLFGYHTHKGVYCAFCAHNTLEIQFNYTLHTYKRNRCLFVLRDYVVVVATCLTRVFCVNSPSGVLRQIMDNDHIMFLYSDNSTSAANVVAAASPSTSSNQHSLAATTISDALQHHIQQQQQHLQLQQQQHQQFQHQRRTSSSSSAFIMDAASFGFAKYASNSSNPSSISNGASSGGNGGTLFKFNHNMNGSNTSTNNNNSQHPNHNHISRLPAATGSCGSAAAAASSSALPAASCSVEHESKSERMYNKRNKHFTNHILRKESWTDISSLLNLSTGTLIFRD